MSLYFPKDSSALLFESRLISIAGEWPLFHFDHGRFFQHFERMAAAAEEDEIA